MINEKPMKKCASRESERFFCVFMHLTNGNNYSASGSFY